MHTNEALSANAAAEETMNVADEMETTDTLPTSDPGEEDEEDEDESEEDESEDEAE